jgi:hypothetical protein
LQNTVILSAVLALCIFADSELVERFAKPAVELTADWMIALSERAHPPATTVVMITDEDSPEMADAWPLPISAYTRFVQRAWCLGAKKVFLDIGLPRDLPGPDGLPPGPCALSEQTVADPTTLPQGSREAFCSEVNKFRTTVMNLGGSHSQTECPPHSTPQASMPVLLSEQYDKGLRGLSGLAPAPQYVSAFVGEDNLYVAAGPHDPNYDRSLPTAAFALAGCDTVGGKHKSDDCPDEFEVRDTSMTPAQQRTFSHPGPGDRGCLYRDEPWWSQIHLFIEAAFVHLAVGRRADWAKCPPVLTVHWNEVFNPYRQAEVGSAFNDRLVLVSASVSGVSDLAQADLHKDLPGVYLHALAAESLVPGSVSPARQAGPYSRILLFLLGSFLVLQVRYWRPLLTARAQLRDAPAGTTPPIVTQDTSVIVMSGNDVRTDDHRQNSIIAAEHFHTERLAVPAAERTSREADTEWSIGPVLWILPVLMMIYWGFEWKLSLAGRDLLFFLICNTDEIWWLDPTRVFGGVINVFKDRLHNN